MAQYNFEGDFGNINERQLEFINKVVLEQDFEVRKVTFNSVGQAGDNFVGNIKRINLEGDNGNMNMILKIASPHEIVRKTTNTEYLFRNEHIMYTEVLPKLVQLQIAAGVPEEEHLRYAKCYGSLNETPDEIIILEDLKESEFIMLDKFQSLSDECVKSILKNFATLHSLSYALKKMEPETYDHFKEKLTDVWTAVVSMPDIMTHMQQLETNIISILDDDDHKSVIKNKVADILKVSTKLSRYAQDNKHSIILQGDAWTNNVMFKFEGDKLLQSVMIDYQASNNNNPVIDLLYMIFNCTDHETRSKHFYDWLDYYHSELDNSLSNFGLKANFVYSRDQLDTDLKRYAKLLFGLSLILANVLMRDSKEASELLEAMKSVDLADQIDSMSSLNLQSETVVRLKKRIVGLIDSYKEFGLL